MNDRFRFRLWDADLQTYFFSNDDGSLQFDIEKVLDGLNITDGDVLEQCTGLKDKNGNLIYEGDIVWTDEDGYGHIRWDNELAQFFVATEEYYTFDNIFPSEMEVVGNIHENPELLEDK